jgi:hypothetical protein
MREETSLLITYSVYTAYVLLSSYIRRGTRHLGFYNLVRQ